MNYSAFFLVRVDLISGPLPTSLHSVMIKRWQIDGERIQNAAPDLAFSMGSVCCQRHLADGLEEVGPGLNREGTVG